MKSYQDIKGKTPEDFMSELQATSNQLRALLVEINETQVDFESIKAEMKNLIENFEVLSNIIRQNDGSISILSRLALIEISLREIDKWIIKREEIINVRDVKNTFDRPNYMLAILFSALAIIISSISLFMNIIQL